MLVSTALALGLSLGLSTSASPLLQHRQDDSTTSSNGTSPDNSTTSDSVLKPETVAALEATALALNIPGAIVAYTSPKGDGVFTFGNKSVEGEPINPDTHFALASNSKLFLGTVLAWLAEKNTTTPNGDVWTLEMPLKDFVPDFKMYDDNATQQANTLDFLSHQTGLPPHNFAINPSDTSKTWMERLRYLKPIHGFRGGLMYSNVNYAAIGYVVEVLTGRSYYDVLDEYIFKLLDMDAGSDYAAMKASGADISNGWLGVDLNYTQCILDAAELAESAGNSTSDDTGSESDPLASAGYPPSCLGVREGIEFWTEGAGQDWGAGGNVLATGNDLGKWMKEILNPTHIPASVFERVETPPYPDEAGLGYALGTVAAPYRGFLGSTHDGALPGSNSITMRIRNESVGVFALSTDDSYASIWYNIALPAVLDDLLDLPPPEADNSTDGSGGGTSDTASNPLESLPVRNQSPEDARPPPDTAEYLGQTFEAPGYAPFTLSTIDLSNFETTESNAIPIDFLKIDVSTLQQLPFDGEVLYAQWGQTVAEHLLFSHYDGPMYNVTVLASYQRIGPDYSALPTSNLTEETTDTAFIGKWWGGPTAVFAEGGIGFFDGFWASQGTEGNVMPVEEGVKDAAEVFFARQ